MLNKLEKLTKTDLTYYFKNGFWLGSSQILTALLSLLTMSAMGFFLPKETFGEYRYLLSVASVIGIFYLSGYSTTITQEIAKGNLSFYLTASKNVFYSSFVGTLISLILSAYYFYNQNYTLGMGLFLIGFATPFINNYLLANSFFSGLKEFKKTAVFSLIPDVLSTLCLISVSFYSKSVTLLLFTYLITNLIGNYIIHKIILNKISVHKSEGKEEMENIFNIDSLHYSLMNFIAVIGINFDKLLIFTLIGSKELAIFFFAQSIPLQARGMLRIIHNLTFPKFVEKEINSTKVNRSIVLLLLFGIAGVIIYILLAPLIFKILFPQYIESIYMTKLFALSVIVYPAIYLMSGIMLAKNSTNYLYKISVSNSTLNLILLLIFIPIWGVLGAIYATIVNSFIYFLTYYYFLMKNE